MKRNVRICDFCMENDAEIKIKYKVKAKRHWVLWYEEGWERIDVCEKCLDEIITAKNKFRLLQK